MGREVVEKLTGKTVLDSMDGFSLATANTPSRMSVIAFVPFDPISYAAGLTSIRFRSFLSPPGSNYRRLLFILGGQHVNRRYFLVCHRTVYSVCPDRGDFMAKIWLERQKRNA